MRIIVDAMSGDNAPLEIIKGVGLAAAEYKNEQFTLVGNEEIIKKTAADENIDISAMEIVHTEGVISMHDDPLSIAKAKRDSSMGVALQLLADGRGDVLVSAGNTGALFTGASLIVRKMKGVLRPAIGTLMPFNPPVILLDSGANLVINEENMEQFAHMGSAYMKKMYGLEAPRVGILNNGEEDCKGLELQINSYKRLSDDKDINFVGNIEGTNALTGDCDVLVADGFAGNQVLKNSEGIARRIITDIVKYAKMTGNTEIMQLVKHLMGIYDFNSLGGAIILGAGKPVIKAHGAANADSIMNTSAMLLNIVKNRDLFYGKDNR